MNAKLKMLQCSSHLAQKYNALIARDPDLHLHGGGEYLRQARGGARGRGGQHPALRGREEHVINIFFSFLRLNIHLSPKKSIFRTLLLLDFVEKMK